MPLISDLKKLGTLPVPELKTELTVYLINLDDSQETNLVYVPRDPVSSDASPPPHLLFECAETRTKEGDVLIWASRTKGRATSALSCWVFDGTAWKRTNSDFKVMMDHPKYPEYQLVIMRGPSVKWQLKSGSVRESPSTVPRPPRARSHTLATMNTIITDVPRYPLQGPYEHNAESGTPEGSSGLCGSSVGSPSEPLSDTLSGFEKLRNTAIPYNPNKHATESPYPRSNDPLSQSNLEKAVFGKTPKTPKSFPSGKQSTKHFLATPQEGRASPDDHVAPPLAEILSPKSTSQSISRTITIPATPPRSAPPSPLKRSRNRSGEHEYAWSASHSSSHTNYDAGQSSPFPAARRRRLEDGKETLPGTRSYTLKTLTPMDAAEGVDADADADADAEGEDDSDICPEDVVTPARGNNPFEQKFKQQSAAMNLPPESNTQSAEQSLSAMSNLQEKSLPGALPQEEESLDTAVHIAQQLHAYIVRSAAGLVETKKENELKLHKLQGERNDALAALDDLKHSEEEARNACREANELANALKSDLQLLRQSEASLLQARDNLGKQLISARSELDTTMKANQTRLESDAKQLEETKERVEEQRGRADHFEKSLRIAQEALQRQRTLAQEEEASQRSTITQLAKEYQEKDKSAKQLAEEVEAMTRRIAELSASLSASEHALGNEKENVKRAMEELECVRSTVKEKCAKIERLDAARVESACNLAAAEEQVSTLNTRIEQLQKEGAARDAALTKEAERREMAEQQSQTLHVSMKYLDDLRVLAESQLVQENTDKQEAESQRDFQKAQFSEYLSLADKERKRLEHVLLEEASSLRQDLKVVGRDLESAKARCAKLTQERNSERDKLNAEVASKQQRLEDALKEQKALQQQLQSRAQQVKEAQRDCAQTKSSAAAEREKINKDRSSLRAETERELGVLRGRVAESVEAKKQAEARCAALDAKVKEKTKAWIIKQAEYKILQAELSSERERLTKEVSTTGRRLEAQLEDSRKEMRNLRKEHDTAVLGFQAERDSFESKLHSAANELASTQATVSQKETELQTERDRFAAELSSVRIRSSYVKKELAAAQQQCSQVEETLAKERASFSEEREQLVSERTSAQENLSSLQKSLETKLSELQKRLQASFKEQESDSALKLLSLQQWVQELEEQLSEAEQRQTHLKSLFADERAALEEQLRSSTLKLEEERSKCANATSELGDERRRVEDLTSSRATLEKELDSCRSRLALIEEKGTRAEAVQADLQLQYSSVSAKLETVQGEYERLKATLSAEREHFKAERSMSSDGLRGKVASLETSLKREQDINRALQEEQTKDESMDYWSDLSSQLLRSLHKAQDRLKAEEAAHHALQVQMEERFQSRNSKGGPRRA